MDLGVSGLKTNKQTHLHFKVIGYLVQEEKLIKKKKLQTLWMEQKKTVVDVLDLPTAYEVQYLNDFHHWPVLGASE